MDIQQICIDLERLNSKVEEKIICDDMKFEAEFDEAIRFYETRILSSARRDFQIKALDSCALVAQHVKDLRNEINANSSGNYTLYHELYAYAKRGKQLLRHELQCNANEEARRKNQYREYINKKLMPELNAANWELTKPLCEGVWPYIGIVYRTIPLKETFAAEYTRNNLAFLPSAKAIGHAVNYGLIRLTAHGADAQNELVRQLAGYVQNIMYVEQNRPCRWRVAYFDCVTYNAGASFGKFGEYCSKDTYSFMTPVPLNSNESVSTLNKLMEIMSAETEHENRLIIIRGWESFANEPVFKRMIEQHNMLALQMVLIVGDSRNTDVLAGTDCRHFSLSGKELVSEGGEKSFIRFASCRYTPTEISKRNIIKNYAKPVVKLRYPDNASLKPSYTNAAQGDVDIKLVYGKDKAGNFCCLDTMETHGYDGLNFFTYVLGGAGSGKTSLLNTLIASVVFNYHPDDVELWLVDFNAVEFRKYGEHMPPHVRYILLDKTPDMVFSLLERINDEIERRKKLFLENIPNNRTARKKLPREKLPYVIVIIDEFPFMNDALTNGISVSEDYRSMFENIINTGRKFGFRFVFAGQTYGSSKTSILKNVAGNMYGRMGMFTMERSDLTELLGSKTLGIDQVNFLPPHKVLQRYEEPPRSGKYSLKLVDVFYFDKDAGDEVAYMKALDDLRKNPMLHYADKHPVVIDSAKGVKLDKALTEEIKASYEHVKAENSSNTPLVLFPGGRRSMDRIVPVCLHNDQDKENLLVVGSSQYFQSEIQRIILGILYYVLAIYGTTKDIEIWTEDTGLWSNGAWIKAWSSAYGCIETYRGNEKIFERVKDIYNKAISDATQNRLIIITSPKVLKKKKKFSDSIRDDSIQSKKTGWPPRPEQQNAADNKTPTEMLENLMKIGTQFGIHFICLAETTNALVNEGGEFIRNNCNHIIAFSNSVDTQKGSDIDISYRVNKLLQGDGLDKCFVYTDKQMYAIMEPFTF